MRKLIGKYPAKVDDKNRLFVPAKLREELGSTFYVTIGGNGNRNCLTVYTESGWQRLMEKYNQLTLTQQASTASFLFSYATECSPDKQFRFTLTQPLLAYAGITRDVVIVGRAGQAEIWDAQSYADFEAEALSPAKLFASLEAIGL